jgi:hypothetical protein
VTFATRNYSAKLFKNLTELKKGFEMKRKKVKVVYKPLNTSFKVLFKTSFFQSWFAGISCRDGLTAIRAESLGQNTISGTIRAGIA